MVSVWLARISDRISLTISSSTVLFSSIRVDLESLLIASGNDFCSRLIPRPAWTKMKGSPVWMQRDNLSSLATVLRPVDRSMPVLSSVISKTLAALKAPICRSIKYFPQGFDIGDTEAEGTNIVLVAVDPTNNAHFSVRKGSISEQKSKKSLTNVSFRSPDRLDRNLHRGRVKVKNFYCLVFSGL